MKRLKRLLATLALLAVVLAGRDSSAFCGFYVGGADAKLFNDATVVVLMREGTRTVLAMQNSYKGPPEKFAMVVPVPVILQEENVKTLKRELFDHVDQLASPRLVEYWEQDPCAQEANVDIGLGRSMKGAPPTAAAQAVPTATYGVTVEAKFAVGEYQIVILSAKDSSGLEAYLHAESYTIPEGAEPYFRPYVASGSKFFVAKVDPQKVKMVDGLAELSPLRFHYDSEEFRLPVRLGLINSSGTQDLIVHILGRGTRYEVANYPNVTIPTNLDVTENARESFGQFYTSLFDRTLEKNPKAVVTEYAWEPTNCDPCPGPALDMSDLTTLGGDVLPSSQPPHPTFNAWSGGSMVLTRLHARYTKETLGEDLIFKAAPAIVGGREIVTNGALEHGAQPSGFNSFQARYAIRHGWAGPIDCKDPRRGVWGAKPGSGDGPPPTAAQKLGLVPRHARTQLASYVKQDIPEIGFERASSSSSSSSSSAKDPSAKKGCLGCATTTRTDTFGSLSLVGLVVFALRGRKR